MMEYIADQIGKLIIQFHISLLNRSLRPVPKEQIESWFKEKDMFFLLSLGRSGSMFLANLLNKASGAQVCHEPTRLDFLAHTRAFAGRDKKFDYISDFRRNYIYRKNRKIDFNIYGEVNSLLRRHPQEIKRNLPNVKIFHLVRDGRDVVRSMMARRTFTARDPFSLIIKPKRGEDYFENWAGMDRFERLCWYWWVENQYLDRLIVKPLLFEKLIRDYGYFKENLLVPLGLDISRDIWKDLTLQPKNTTNQHAIPHWKNWSSERKDQFDKICGSLMERFGYYGS